MGSRKRILLMATAALLSASGLLAIGILLGSPRSRIASLDPPQ